MLDHSVFYFFFFSSRRRHTRFSRDWSSDVCSSDLLRRGSRRDRARGRRHDRQGAAVLRPPRFRRALRRGCQIGRASCRERVSNWEVAVSIEEKKKRKSKAQRKRVTTSLIK